MNPLKMADSRPVRMALTPEGFARIANVSRETLERLKLYVDLLVSWNRRINLVGRNTIGDVWRRHILDSAQLYRLLSPHTRILVDLGSGAGLPGLVLAIMGVPEVHLVKSDQRKASFLREAVRLTGTTVSVHAERAETMKTFVADAVTARALAPLLQLLDLSDKFCSVRTLRWFLKGASVEPELAEIAGRALSIDRIQSATDPAGTILRIAARRSARP